MQKWEYLMISCSQDYNHYRPTFYNGKELPNWKKNPPVNEYLNGLGLEGWELVSSIPIGPYGGELRLILKRAVNS